MPLPLRTILLLGTLSLLCFPLIAAASSSPTQDVYHSDHRDTPKLLFEPSWSAPAQGLSNEGLVRSYLADRALLFGLPSDLANLTLIKVQSSLTPSRPAVRWVYRDGRYRRAAGPAPRRR